MEASGPDFELDFDLDQETVTVKEGSPLEYEDFLGNKEECQIRELRDGGGK